MISPDLEGQDALDMAELVSGRTAGLDRLIERHGTKLYHYLALILPSPDLLLRWKLRADEC